MKYDRQKKIRQLFIERKQLSCKDLCTELGISIETARRDLAELEREGVIKRVYGGAVLIDNQAAPNPIQPRSTRMILNHEEKVNMAKEMVRYIHDNMTIALDSGTTLLEFARLLDQYKNLTVITNDIHIALELSRSTDHTIYLIGGFLKKDDRITTGFLATEFLNNFSHIDAAILTADGFSDGIGDFNANMCALKAAMIGKADKVYAILDHTKFSIPALYKVCAPEALDLLITGAAAPAESIHSLQQAGVEVIQVPC